MHILSDEFSRQAYMEAQLSIKSSLVSQPRKDNISLFRAQLGFMNMFAIPLFQGVANIMPAMQYCVDELEVNKSLFEKGIAEETAKLEPETEQSAHGAFSPRSMSLAVPNDENANAKEIPPIQLPVASSAEDAQASLAPNCDDGHATLNGNTASSEGVSPCHAPTLDGMYKAPNGMPAQFDAVAEFAASDPFNINDGRPFASSKQRVSEATDGSTSVPGGGDWASQATSATTGKMPLSPSTQGTSIISRDSLERPSSLPVAAAGIPAQADSTKSTSIALTNSDLSHEEDSSHSSESHGNDSRNHKSYREGALLKKKSSRFRMNAFTFFRRHLSQSPPLPTSNNDHPSN